MSKVQTDSFVLELPLQTSPQEERELGIRLEVARLLYNTCLGECLRRIDLIRESRAWREGRKLQKCKENSARRRELFQLAQREKNFSEYSLHTFVGNLRKTNCFARHIDCHSAQKIATKAFWASKEHLVGKRGRPRFKRRERFRSIEGKSNAAGIRWKEGAVFWNVRGGLSLRIKALIGPKDKHGVQEYGLKCRTKYVRLVRKVIRGKDRWFAQLVQEGRPLQKAKNTSREDVVGLDLGPSTIAGVSSRRAFLAPFCMNLKSKENQIRSLQKKMERSRRKTNPKNYNSDGTIKSGRKGWYRSNRYKTLQVHLAEEQRTLRETRKRLHGELANRVLGMGNIIRLEKLSYRSFQRDFGRSVGFRAPGMFVSLLRRKAENAGGVVEEFSPYDTRLSQSCHCGKLSKKDLSERWHSCSCGVLAQRDLYSAYLARYVEKNSLDTSLAQCAWPAAEPLLEHAVSRLNQQVKGKARLSSFGFSQRQSLSHVKEESLHSEAQDVVGFCREPGRAVLICP